MTTTLVVLLGAAVAGFGVLSLAIRRPLHPVAAIVAALALLGSVGLAQAQSHTRCLDKDGAVVLTMPWTTAAATCAKEAPALPPAAPPQERVLSAREHIAALDRRIAEADAQLAPYLEADAVAQENAEQEQGPGTYALGVRREQAAREHARDQVVCDKAFRDFAYPGGAISLNRLPGGLRGRCTKYIGRLGEQLRGR